MLEVHASQLSPYLGQYTEPEVVLPADKLGDDAGGLAEAAEAIEDAQPPARRARRVAPRGPRA